mgnify:FL=1
MFYTNKIQRRNPGFRMILFVVFLLAPFMIHAQTSLNVLRDSLNFQAVVECDDVHLTWNEQLNRRGLNTGKADITYNIYRGDSLLNPEPFNNTSFWDKNVRVGIYEYFLEVVSEKNKSDFLADSLQTGVGEYYGEVELTAGAEGLEWSMENAQTQASIQGYNVFRENELLMENTNQTFFLWNDAPEVPLEYCVVAEFQNGCQSQMDCDTVPIITSAEPLTGSEVEIKPNPASESVQINSPALLSSIIVYNSSGRRILEKEINKQEFILPVSNFSEGMYYLHFVTAQGISGVKKFLVE